MVERLERSIQERDFQAIIALDASFPAKPCANVLLHDLMDESNRQVCRPPARAMQFISRPTTAGEAIIPEQRSGRGGMPK
ncbi:hypothetical protein ACFQ07_32160 [Actinomadura adrarensis]|uniref:Transposase n=1 Tax=Actinomadura adrarensis TaxID=1819600 RepID=A0ABW3CSE7_9ACTN